jgi:hypothetical protein
MGGSYKDFFQKQTGAGVPRVVPNLVAGLAVIARHKERKHGLYITSRDLAVIVHHKISSKCQYV